MYNQNTAASSSADHNYMSRNKLHSKGNIATTLTAKKQKRIMNEHLNKKQLRFYKYFSDDKIIIKLIILCIILFKVDYFQCSRRYSATIL